MDRKIVNSLSIWVWHDAEPKDVGFGSFPDPYVPGLNV